MDFNKSFSLWPIVPFGAEDDEQNTQVEPPAQNQSNNQGAQDNSDDDDPYAGLSSKELRKLLRDSEAGKQEAENNLTAANSKLAEKDREKLSKEEALQADLDAERENNKTLRATMARQAIINAIVMDTRYEWHNPEVVAQQLNSDVVKVGDDGKVDGIVKELARVAKDHEYLLKKKVRQQDSNSNSGKPPEGPTGFQPGQGGANSGGTMNPSAKDLAKTFPALANRL